MSITREQVDRFVLEAVADATGVDVSSLRRSTALADTQMDSLTLVAIVARAEAAYGAVFDADELAEILRARSVAELAALVARKVRATSHEFAQPAEKRELPLTVAPVLMSSNHLQGGIDHGRMDDDDA